MSVQTTSAYIQRRSVDKENGVRILVAPFDPPASMLTWHETQGGMNNSHMDHPTHTKTEMATLKRGGAGVTAVVKDLFGSRHITPFLLSSDGSLEHVTALSRENPRSELVWLKAHHFVVCRKISILVH